MRDRVKEQIARWVEPSASTFSGEVRLLAVHSVGPSAVDALIVLGIRAVRRLWAPVMVLRLLLLVLEGSPVDAQELALGSPREVLAALLSPFAGIVLAIGIRIVTLVLGTLAALPHAVAEQRATDPRSWSVLRSPADVIGLTAAYRLARFTSAARDVAASRLGPFGRGFLIADRVETWLTPVTLVILVTTLLVLG